MDTKMDRRVRKTRSQLRKGLASLMKEKSINEITVKELVDKVDINRSTFYLHYTDIYDLLQQTEDELMDEITRTIAEHGNADGNTEMKVTFPFMEDIFETISANRDICTALIGTNGDINFIHRVENIIAQNTIERLTKMCPENANDLKYYYSFCLTGCVGLIKTWLSENRGESPSHMAQLAYQMVINAMETFFEKSNSIPKA